MNKGEMCKGNTRHGYTHLCGRGHHAEGAERVVE